MSKFSFNASALGIGGRFTTPNGNVGIIPSLASVALAPTGGEGVACVENYHSELVSFTRAESRVIGSPLGSNVFSTYADIFITNLTLFERFRVALMQATITSTRDIDEPDARFQIHALFRGVSVDGEEVLPVLDYDICSPTMYDQFADMLCKKHETLPAYKELYGDDPVKLKESLADRSKPFRGTLVTELQVRKKDKVERAKKTVPIPGLGRVRFGEYFFKPGQRRVNLLRLELGEFPEPTQFADVARRESSAYSGDFTAASVEGNGAPIDENEDDG